MTFMLYIQQFCEYAGRGHIFTECGIATALAALYDSMIPLCIGSTRPREDQREYGLMWDVFLVFIWLSGLMIEWESEPTFCMVTRD